MVDWWVLLVHCGRAFLVEGQTLEIGEGKLYGKQQWRTLAKQFIKKQIQNSHSFSGEEFREGTFQNA